MSKRWLIIVSVGIHVGVAVGLFVSGVWHLERLEGGKPSLALGVMIPGADPGGGEAGHKPEEPKTVPPKKLLPKTELRNVDKLPLEKTADAPTTDATGAGDGSGSGKGPGSGDGPPGPGTGGGGGGEGPPCLPGDACNAPLVTPPPVIKTAIVPPNVLAGLRISGETQIMPSDPVKTEMMRDGRDKSIGSFKVCIDTSGAIASVSIVGSTKYATYDATIVGKVRDWRYKPYLVNGVPVSACSVVTFQYSMK